MSRDNSCNDYVYAATQKKILVSMRGSAVSVVVTEAHRAIFSPVFSDTGDSGVWRSVNNLVHKQTQVDNWGGVDET